MTSSLVGSEMCIRDRFKGHVDLNDVHTQQGLQHYIGNGYAGSTAGYMACLLYTSDAADDM
eukprot:11544701-Prorocentrum_lima.AAC.1